MDNNNYANDNVYIKMDIKIGMSAELQASSFCMKPNVKKNEPRKKENEKIESVENTTETHEDKKGL